MQTLSAPRPERPGSESSLQSDGPPSRSNARMPKGDYLENLAASAKIPTTAWLEVTLLSVTVDKNRSGVQTLNNTTSKARR